MLADIETHSMYNLCQIPIPGHLSPEVFSNYDYELNLSSWFLILVFDTYFYIDCFVQHTMNETVQDEEALFILSFLLLELATTL